MKVSEIFKAIDAMIESLPEDIRQARDRVNIEADRVEARVDPIGRVIRRVLSDGISTKDGCA